MEIIREKVRCDIEARTETALAEYRINYSTEDARLRYVSATVRTRGDNPVQGSVRYRNGQYEVGTFPYGQQQLEAVMEDFADVVAALQQTGTGASTVAGEETATADA